jgi:ferric-dicitrate binding protein FerR (iron transport regulator)
VFLAREFYIGIPIAGGPGCDPMMRIPTSTPATLLRWTLAIFATVVLNPKLLAESVTSTNASSGSRLVGFVGSVEATLAGTNDWHRAFTNQWLYPGDRLRTGLDSRATLQLSDRSIVRINQSTIIEIRSPAPPARHNFNLKRGVLYFLDREKPADIEFETPLSSGAIRGTEFLLAVTETNQATYLALLDGAVDL